MGGVLQFLCLVLFVTYYAEANNPGFKTRITSKGLKYANDVAIQALKENVMKTTIPDQRGDASGFEYSVTNVHISEFDPPGSSISLAPGQGLTWMANNAGIKVEGDFHYSKWIVSDSGSFDAKLSGVSFNLGINVGTDANGRPSIASRSCSSSIGNVDFTFHGGMEWLYNLLKGKVGNLIKDTLNKQMCTLVQQAIDKDAEKKLATLPVTTELAHKFLLDYRLDQAPLFTSGYMETFHKGEIFWVSDPTTESPMVAPPMGDSGDTQDMLYLWVSDYMFDTVGFVAQKHGFLVYNLTTKDLPPANRGVLNTTCDGSFIPKCVGRLIPQIGKTYPNSQVELRMSSTTAPTMKISTSGIAVNCAGTINMFARVPGKTDTPFLVALDATMSATVKVSIQNELLFAQIDDLSLKLRSRKSAVGEIPDMFLNFLIKEALTAYLVPTLNDLGKKGFPLPVTGEIQFVNTKISFVQDAIVVGTDLKYTAGRQSQEDAIVVGTALKYTAGRQSQDINSGGSLKFQPKFKHE